MSSLLLLGSVRRTSASAFWTHCGKELVNLCLNIVLRFADTKNDVSDVGGGLDADEFPEFSKTITSLLKFTGQIGALLLDRHFMRLFRDAYHELFHSTIHTVKNDSHATYLFV